MKTTILLLASAAIFSACGGNPPVDVPKTGVSELQEEKTKNEKPEAMSFDEALAYSKSDEKLVEIEGYIQLSVISNFSADGQTMDFYGRKNQRAGKSFYTTMPVGNGNNKMKQLPKEYYSSDVEIIDDKGNKVGANERIKITGYIYSLSTSSYLKVKKIEKVEEQPVDYASLNFPKLNFADKDKSSNHEKPFYLEGKLDVPMYVLVDDETTVDLKAGGNSFPLKLVTGTGPSQIEELKEGWTPNSVKIRNIKGNLIKKGQNVKVYGVLKLDGLHVEAIVQ